MNRSQYLTTRPLPAQIATDVCNALPRFLRSVTLNHGDADGDDKRITAHRNEFQDVIKMARKMGAYSAT